MVYPRYASCQSDIDLAANVGTENLSLTRSGTQTDPTATECMVSQSRQSHIALRYLSYRSPPRYLRKSLCKLRGPRSRWLRVYLYFNPHGDALMYLQLARCRSDLARCSMDQVARSGHTSGLEGYWGVGGEFY